MKVLIAPHDWFSQGARIKGDGPGDVDFQSADASLAQENGKWYATAAITASHVLDNTVYHYDPKADPRDPFAVAWSLSRDDGGSWHQVPPSENEVFVTLGAPPQQNFKLYRTVGYLATANGGAIDSEGALTNTWAMFSPVSGVEGEDVCAWNEDSRTYDRPLHYYQDPFGHFKTDVAGLLEAGDGQCHAWADLFNKCLCANGITQAKRTRVRPPSTYAEFGVCNIGFDDEEPTYPDEPIWRYSRDDLNIAMNGIQGQNMPTPAAKLFERHFLVSAYLVHIPGRPDFYDPSYGISTTSASDYTSRAIAAWAKDFSGQRRWRKAEGPELLRFNDEDWTP